MKDHILDVVFDKQKELEYLDEEGASYPCKKCSGKGLISIEFDVKTINTTDGSPPRFMPYNIKKVFCDICGGLGKVDWVRNATKSKVPQGGIVSYVGLGRRRKDDI